MSQGIRYTVIAGVTVVLAIIVFLVLRHISGSSGGSPTTATVTVSPSPPAGATGAPQAQPASAATPGQGAPTTPPSPATIAEFLNQTYRMAGTADALDSPVAGATVLGRVHQGAEIKVVGVLADKRWLQIELPDKRVGYIPAAAIPDAVAGGTSAPGGLASNAASSSGGASGGATSSRSTEGPEFQSTADEFSVATPTSVYGAPDTGTPSISSLKVGSIIQGVAKSNDGKWLWVQTVDGREAYVQMATLTPAKSKTDPGTPDLPDHVSGSAKVLTTATVVVDGQRLQLVGIKGESGDHAAQLQILINAQGGSLDCTRHGKQFVCALPDGIDIARAALFNGAARPTANASADYRQQAESAKSAGRGVWGQ
jgi:hypothetical protein